jgi:hypothetical protein
MFFMIPMLTYNIEMYYFMSWTVIANNLYLNYEDN